MDFFQNTLMDQEEIVDILDQDFMLQNFQ